MPDCSAGCAFGHQDKMVPGGQVLQCLGHSGAHFNRMLGDDVRESDDGFVQRRRERFYGQAFKSLCQSVGEAVQSVTVADDALPLYFIQDFANFGGRIFVMIQERDEIGDGAFEIDVVFPKRVIGIDEQGLAAIICFARHRNMIAAIQ